MPLVNLRNCSGSQQHFFHYLLGYLVPLFEHYTSIFSTNNEAILLRSCGLLDAHTHSFSLPNTKIIAAAEFDALASHEPQLSPDVQPAKSVQPALEFQGRDHVNRYCESAFHEATDLMKAVWAQRWNDSLTQAAQAYGTAPRKLLFIRRSAPHPFYSSPLSDIQGAGTSRRSIPNHEDVLEAIRAHSGHCVDGRLEETDLATQAALFSEADTVIAQHGAALANIIWMRPGSKVIEIRPISDRKGQPYRDFFGRLGTICGVDYTVVTQSSDHSSVCLEQIVSALGDVQ